VLINLGPADWLKDSAHDGNVNTTQGYDFVFTSGSNNIRYDCEIEKYNGTSGTLVAWVRIPSLSGSSNTTIRMYYGNSEITEDQACNIWQRPTYVWNSSYKLVQHLEESCASSGCIEDSTINNNDGTPYSSTTITNLYNSSGQINGADDFDGLDDYINCSDDASLRITGPLTIEAWVNFDSLGDTGDYIGLVAKWDYTDGGWVYGIFREPTSNKFSFHLASKAQSGNTWVVSNSVPSLNQWYHLVGAYDGTTMLLYINGAQQTDTATISGIYNTTTPVTIGMFEPTNNFWLDGTIDEVRISNMARSADWINTCYNNQNNPSTFYDVKSEINGNPEQPIPELSTTILFAVGLLSLAGYICVVRRRRRE